MSVDPYKIFNPTNPIRYEYTPVTELKIQGYIGSTSNGYGSLKSVDGFTSSENVCIGYDVTLTYTGPADIGERIVHRQRLPNYWTNNGFQLTATQMTGITPDGKECVTDAIALGSILCCICCCVFGCVNDHRRSRIAQLNAKINELCSAHMSKVLAEMLQNADKEVSERIQYKEATMQRQMSVAAPVGAGAGAGTGITLSPEQFAMLIKQVQQPPAQIQTASSLSAGSAGSAGPASAVVIPFTPQYQAQVVPSAPSQASSVVLADIPVTTLKAAKAS